MDDPVHQKLDRIEDKVDQANAKIESVHDRMDREVGERAHGLQRIYQAIVDLEHRVITFLASLIRKPPP